MRQFDTTSLKNAVMMQGAQLELLRKAHHQMFDVLKEDEKLQLSQDHMLRLKPPDAISPFFFVMQPTLIVKTDCAVNTAVIFSDFSDEKRSNPLPTEQEVLFENEESIYKPSHNAFTIDPIDFPDNRPLDQLLPQFRDASIDAYNIWKTLPTGPSTQLLSQVLFVNILDEYNRILSEYVKIFIQPPVHTNALKNIFQVKQSMFVYYTMFNLHHALAENPYEYKITETHNTNLTLLEQYFMKRASDPYPFEGVGTGVDRRSKLLLALRCYDAYVKDGKVNETLKAESKRGTLFSNTLADTLNTMQQNLVVVEKNRKKV